MNIGCKSINTNPTVLTTKQKPDLEKTYPQIDHQSPKNIRIFNNEIKTQFPTAAQNLSEKVHGQNNNKLSSKSQFKNQEIISNTRKSNFLKWNIMESIRKY